MPIFRFMICIVVAVVAMPVAMAAEFPSSGIQFGSSGLDFPSQALTFPGTAIDFPSQQIQTESAGTIEITLPADILFDFDKADLRPAAEGVLREVAGLVREKARGPVAVQGYTDALGSDPYNQKLSERRANAVKAWLVSKEKLPAARLAATGFGARSPVAPNRKADGSDDPDGRQLNRRVTLIIRK